MIEKVGLTFNAGSSSLKIGIFDIGSGNAKQVGRGTVLLGEQSRLRYSIGDERKEVELPGVDRLDERLVSEIFDRLLRAGSAIGFVGHRVVHGGSTFRGPAVVDDASLSQIEDLVPLAPLHQPKALEVIHAVRALHPSVIQTASFDTAFHSSQGSLSARLAIPRAMHDAGIRRYGFHGLSYKFVSGQLKKIAPDISGGRLICAHLGSGASLCGMIDGVSMDTSMGFSALDGVPMATRPGSIDAGALVHLLRTQLHDADRLEDFLYHQCGLLGVSGISGDTRVLAEDSHPEAKEALALFCFRIAGEIGRLAVSIGGIDALVFTAGIGENQPEIRKGVERHLGWMGLSLSEAANKSNATVIGARGSKISAFVIPTDEEQVIADEALAVIRQHRL
ncbi:acetate/propionate family kinase [Rhizobium sp. P32RR-XVIII]|uniref:acetate/propionate family kinase n=1 Tax=Rhizobium sp. P32RR-XVIII TaxID=2726738 RepID=UPI00145753DE|nr:acetate/propionate family kinase [Rhizobium sp. P32RR-XVIII]NLS03273.1 acetate/propionate family kinase [Rhizobium sp. P32RR-XVIII]